MHRATPPTAGPAPRLLLLAAPRGFCAGVERAVGVVEAALERYGAPVYVRRQIVHNAHVVADLGRRGAILVDELDDVPEGALVVFSAHGVSRAVRGEAERRGLDVLDATCPLVEKVHREALAFLAQDYSVLLVGHAGHDEVLGTMGQAPGRIALVTNVEDAARVEVPSPHRAACITQATLGQEETAEIVAALRARFPRLVLPPREDICYATTNRQAAARWLADRCDLVLVLGDRGSSNSLRLCEVVRARGRRAELIESLAALDPAWLEGVRTVGLTTGASAPERLVRDVVDFFRTLGTRVIEERLLEEQVTFDLPPELQRPSPSTQSPRQAVA
jgi:4-hydroxy-3-methylbut-2-en-1-yl diphosphate reductase